MIREVSALILIVASVTLSGALPSVETSRGDSRYEGPLLSSFQGLQRQHNQHPDGTYQFSFSLPQQERQESRDEDGKVTGSFAFVDPVGEEVSLKYDADDEGFRPESDALPQIPEDTDDVQSAREEFLRYYEQTVKFLEALGSDEDSDSSSSSEESDEYDYEDEEEESDDDDDEESDEDSDESEEDSDEESSEEDSDEESSEEDSDEESSEEDSDEESSEEDSDEEDSEEEDEEDEEEEDEEEEEEEEEEDPRNSFRFSPRRKSFFGIRARQQNLSGNSATKQESKKAFKAVFPPLPASSIFGRRVNPKAQ